MFPLSSASCHLGGDTGSGGALMTCATFISNVQLVWTFSGRTQSGQFGRRHHMMIRGGSDTDTTLDTMCHNNNLSIDLRRDLWTYNTYTELHYSYTFY